MPSSTQRFCVDSLRRFMAVGGTCGAITAALLIPVTAGASTFGRNAAIQVQPQSGPAGTSVLVQGRGFRSGRCSQVSIEFKDAAATVTVVGGGYGPTFSTTIVIPSGAARGHGTVTARQWIIDPLNPRRCRETGPQSSAAFWVTSAAARDVLGAGRT